MTCITCTQHGMFFLTDQDANVIGMYPPVNRHGNGHHHVLMGNISSNVRFSPLSWLVFGCKYTGATDGKQLLLVGFFWSHSLKLTTHP